MQLGTRWTVGSPPPERLPEAMRDAVAAVEAEPGVESGWRWTLTWLEGRPVAELDDGTTLRLDPVTGSVVVERAAD